MVDSGRSFGIRSTTGIKSEGQVDGGRTASGGTIPILGIRSLRCWIGGNNPWFHNMWMFEEVLKAVLAKWEELHFGKDHMKPQFV